MKRKRRKQLKRRKVILVVIVVALIGMIWSIYELFSPFVSAELTASPNTNTEVSEELISSPNKNTAMHQEISQRYKIVIDAGHGGKDPGASGVSGNYERAYTLALSNKVFDLLQQEPMFEAYMTRTDDTFVDLDDRINFASDLDADAFVSIHGNTYTDPDVHGTETYYYAEDSSPFANEVHEHLVEAAGFKDRGVRKEGWKVLKESDNLAILLEVGFLTNQSDETNMINDSHQDRTAQGIVKGIKKYFADTEN
ncbi:N-acetylmuramoyl-L-alanine amidase [Paenibacillus sp. FSL K6-0276]|uniref:N-acetylmuramoyl-L-alanine amidase family protein n=1 Tax=Paenibacillus sp. FSL K6-0276 TaxID=2921450 RepID=UPI0030EBA62A